MSRKHKAMHERKLIDAMNLFSYLSSLASLQLHRHTHTQQQLVTSITGVWRVSTQEKRRTFRPLKSHGVSILPPWMKKKARRQSNSNFNAKFRVWHSHHSQKWNASKMLPPSKQIHDGIVHKLPSHLQSAIRMWLLHKWSYYTRWTAPTALHIRGNFQAWIPLLIAATSSTSSTKPKAILFLMFVRMCLASRKSPTWCSLVDKIFIRH